MSMQELRRILKEEKNLTIHLDNDYWWITNGDRDEYGDLISLIDGNEVSYFKGYGSELLIAFCDIQGIIIDPV